MSDGRVDQSDDISISGSFILNRKLKSIAGETSESVEIPNKYGREVILNLLVAKESLPVDNFKLGDVAAMTYGFTREELINLVNEVVLLAKSRNKVSIEKVDFADVVKQSIECTMKNTIMLQCYEDVVVEHEVRTIIATLVPRQLKIWKSGGSCCWFPYVAMDLFDSLPPLADDDVDLTVISCLTLACKMQKRRFDTTAFLLEQGLTYNLEEVVTMERHILRSLEGVIGQLTPFDFLQCLAHDLLQSSDIIRAYHIVVWSKANILFAPFTPFTIALSAILCTISYDDHKSAAIEELQAHGVQHMDECRNLMEAIYQTKLNSLIAGSSTVSEDYSPLNVALGWIDQIPEDRVGLFYGALSCICHWLRC